MSQYQDDPRNNAWGYNPKTDMPTMDLTTLSETALRDVRYADETTKVRAIIDSADIVNHTIVSTIGVICQEALDRRIAMLSQINPAAANNLRELSIANMLYIRNKIYDPNRRR